LPPSPLLVEEPKPPPQPAMASIAAVGAERRLRDMTHRNAICLPRASDGESRTCRSMSEPVCASSKAPVCGFSSRRRGAHFGGTTTVACRASCEYRCRTDPPAGSRTPAAVHVLRDMTPSSQHVRIYDVAVSGPSSSVCQRRRKGGDERREGPIMKITTKMSTTKKTILAALSLAALGAVLAPRMASADEPNPTPPPTCQLCISACVPGPVRCIPHCYPVDCPK